MSDYYTTANYGSMLRDRTRIDGYLNALLKAIVPGETLVLEIGTGTGIVALAAAKAGAKRVYALEPNPAIQVARQIAELNDLDENIEFIQAMSTEVDLPRCDVVISDMRGGTPLLEAHIPSIVDARERLLKPGATMIALADDIWTAPLTAAEHWGDHVGHWDDNPLGLDMTPARRLTANSTLHYPAKREELLAAPGHVAHLDYRTIESANVSAELRFEIDQPGTFHGLSVWFDSQIDEEISLTNAPGNPMLAYGRPFFPVADPFEVDQGDRLDVELSATQVMGSYVWRWRGGVVGDSSRTFEQSTFESSDVTPQNLQLFRADGTPSRNSRGERARFVLQRLDGSTPLREIAEALHRDDPAVDSIQAAITQVSEVVSRYGVANE